jgi:hypothetical protein
MFALGLLLAAAPSPAQTAPMPAQGVSLAHLHRNGVGYGSDACRAQLAALKAMGVNYIALNDFAYIPSINSPEVRYNRDPSLTSDTLLQTVKDAKALGLQVMLKPHLWSRDFGRAGKWHGDIEMLTEADWDTFFAGYTRYLMVQADIATRGGADSLCIGLEYVKASKQTARWRKLIADVREVYKGHLTYSAAFLEWKDIEFWPELDSVGISAYFPIAHTESAGEPELVAGWNRVYAELDEFHKKVNKPIWFLEIGYSRSVTAGREPWSYGIVGEPSDEYQARLYRVAIEQAARRKYIAGVFLWKWFTADSYQRYEGHDPFAIQNNPQVLEAIRQAWLAPSAEPPATPPPELPTSPSGK